MHEKSGTHELIERIIDHRYSDDLEDLEAREDLRKRLRRMTRGELRKEWSKINDG